ncbi:bifunctional riboflavin kinase/FAD synthetase [Thiomicrorhabdus sp. zzn3]|uniref:bifunctional riboflavin kinase/FAD synthetase n=1 Tax=Thiomicrorhabdus sp. zzn3 TaxID=3039775 RepID=UPI0024365370|nr:bifunctional riboflavin kinase/FAD synthetase [Thiomicrorhabdus sp. zzn3]MDG6779089.1 bifunctional riboflavin kinase/FAD synthetase [Thiomicrorhabdus sp. zzn3]
MRLIRGLHNLESIKTRLAQGCVLTIGNFDGVHMGHQQILNAVVSQAHDRGLPSMVMLFEPLPIEFFAPQKAPVRLMNLREKLQALQHTEIDYVLCMRFDREFAELTAEQFVNDILLGKLSVKHLVVGDDFRFGKQRLGNYAYLQQQGKWKGFSVSDRPTFTVAGARVSSTRIRAALAKPDLQEAEALLGAPFTFNGRVIHGQKLGRQIGFPTLNLNPKRLQMPVSGVFAVTVDGIAENPWPGVANVGVRPTVNGHRPSIEVHLFDWHGDLYGRHVDVRLEHYIRPEMKFDGLPSLIKQIEKDAEEARTYFKTH